MSQSLTEPSVCLQKCANEANLLQTYSYLFLSLPFGETLAGKKSVQDPVGVLACKLCSRCSPAWPPAMALLSPAEAYHNYQHLPFAFRDRLHRKWKALLIMYDNVACHHITLFSALDVFLARKITVFSVAVASFPVIMRQNWAAKFKLSKSQDQ